MSLYACCFAGSVLGVQAFFRRVKKNARTAGVGVLAVAGWMTMAAGAQTGHFSGSLR